MRSHAQKRGIAYLHYNPSDITFDKTVCDILHTTLYTEQLKNYEYEICVSHMTGFSMRETDHGISLHLKIDPFMIKDVIPVFEFRGASAEQHAHSLVRALDQLEDSSVVPFVLLASFG